MGLRRLRQIVFFVIFFFSGSAALLYQVIWQRLLTFTTGADAHAVTIVVAGFMAGLGLGSLTGGYLADRLDARGRVLAFAACELAIGAFALISAPLFYDVLYVRLGSWDLSLPALAALSFVATLCPTTLMGMSLPLAARILTQDAARPAEWIALLYGWNTIGAAVGAAATVALMRSIDFTSSLWLGAALNATAGLVALVVMLGPASRVADVKTDAAPLESRPDAATADSRSSGEGLSLQTWILIYVLSGFIALSLEIVWFRVLGVVLKSTSYTFGQLLGLFLLGLGLGSLAAHSRVAQARPAARTFFILQAAIPLYAVGALALLSGAVELSPSLARYLAGYAGPPRSDLSAMFFIVNVVVPVVVMGPPTFFMGLSFGYLQRAVQTDLAGLGRRVGWLQAANIVGAVAGTLITGFFLLDHSGTPGTFRVLIVVNAVFVWLMLAAGNRRGLRSAIARGALTTAVVAAAWTVMPDEGRLWPRFHGILDRVPIYEEDSTGLSLFKPEPENRRTAVYANGLGQSMLPFGGLHSAIGALPALIHPRPARVAVIGLGSGDTTFSIGGRRETESIDSIEIVSATLASLRRIADSTPYPGVRELLQDPRIHHRLTDGRAYLLRSATRYDIIEADALRPLSAYSGNLYSVEYFSLLRSRLEPGGFAVTWIPTPRVLNTLAAVFPHVLITGHIAIGSDQPIPFDPALVRARLRDAFTAAYYGSARLDMAQELEKYLTSPVTVIGPNDKRDGLDDLNLDLFPRDEFRVTRRGTNKP